ncbi:hypothetical protein [Microbulbifer hainanensis]|uniref:hypothetical protein n=1 Tax=Microbulbifer hainanensis TaxID=2735675 RepID=UPI0018684C4B|nr:hypothetical protein [Microbulbifer hainanensis]
MSVKELMEVYLAHQWAFIPLIMLLFIGLTLFWFGGWLAALTALGNKRWLWGISSIFLGPLTGLPYALLHKEAEYPQSLMVKGLGLLLAALVLTIVVWFVVSG